jgi:hypothetical protein
MSRSRVIIVLSVCSTGLIAWPEEARARQRDVEAAREALQRAAYFPWYDRQSDGIQAVPLPEEPPLRRASNWEWKPTSTTNRAQWNSSFWDALWRGVQYTVWIALFVMLVALISVWMRAVARHERARQWDEWDKDDQQRHETASIEQLPFQVKQPQADLLGEARRHYQAHHYNQAIVYLFSYQLVQLDRHQCIHLAKGKTNRQYLGELASEPFLRQRLKQTMLVFEDVFFGHYELGRARFETCWSIIDEFDLHLRQLASMDRPSAKPA